MEGACGVVAPALRASLSARVSATAAPGEAHPPGAPLLFAGGDSATSPSSLLTSPAAAVTLGTWMLSDTEAWRGSMVGSALRCRLLGGWVPP
jgi:hypothetical protein